MAFSAWKDRVTATPHRYKLTEVATDTYDFEAVPGAVSEAGTPVNAENLDRLIQRDGDDIKDTVVAFTEAGARANIATGESTATLFGKVKKYFTDLKAHSFVAPSTTQGTGTTTVPCDNLLTQSSFARVYRSLAEINPTYTDTTPMVDVITSMANNSIAIYRIETDNPLNYPLGDGTCIIEKANINRNSARYIRKTYDTTTTVEYYGSLCGTAGNANQWSGWKQIIDDSSAQTISAIKTYSVSPLVPTTPSGPSAAVAKSYVDTTTINPNILTNADFLINDLGTAVYNVTDTPTVNNWKIKLTNTAGSYTVATKTLKSDNVDIGTDYVHLYQEIPNPMFYNGKTVTFSATATSTTGKWTLILWKGISTIASVAWDTALSRTLTYAIPAGTFTSSDTFRVAIRGYSSTVLGYAKLEVGSVATAFSPEQNTIYSNQNQTISAIKTYATGATPLITDQPTTALMAVNKSYVDSLRTVYDKVIRTQAEFEDLIASSTWLDAKSVAFVGAFTLSTTNNHGVKIPATVKQLHGFNSAKITITNFKYDGSTAKGGLWYDTAPTTRDYSIRDLEVSCTGSDGYSGYGFSYCNNLSNCTGTGAGTGTNRNGYGFSYCNNLSNCTGTGAGTGTGSGYGFFGINYAVNCKNGGSSTDMWGGTNINIDTLTCHKTETTTSNTTLNA